MIGVDISFDKKKPFFYAPTFFEKINKPIRSATGLATSSDKVFCLFFIEGAFHVAALRLKDLSLIYIQELLDVKDGHSILISGDYFYVVSTGTDEVLRYVSTENGMENPEVVWRASNSKIDTHHVNSIIEVGEEIFISAFGEKTGTLWSSATNGYIYNITRDVRVKDRIYHPHSLAKKNGVLHYCDSSRKSFCSIEQPLFELDGYTRGIDWLSDELVCAASSIGRKISKSTGLIANPADPGAVAGKSRLSVKNINNQKTILEIDLSRFGPEIYDVLRLGTEFDTSKLLLVR